MPFRTSSSTVAKGTACPLTPSDWFRFSSGCTRTAWNVAPGNSSSTSPSVAEKAVPGYTVLPEDGPVEKSVLEGALKKIGADGAIVARVLAVDRRTAYSPGYVTVIPSVGYARGFYGFYGSAMAIATPPTPYQYDVVVVETSLWQTRDGTLVWSATTQTTDPGALRKEIAGYADIIIGALRERGLIDGAAQEKK